MDSVFTRGSTQALITLALEEDLAGGDSATEAIFPDSHTSKAKIIAREDLVVCGLPIVAEIIRCARSSISLSAIRAEGSSASANDLLMRLSGPTREILMLERTILNFLQRFSGIATTARHWVAASKGITILDTRKTLPGYRELDKYATRIGGAKNHRMNLSAMAMVKNNHIDGAGAPLREVVQRIRSSAPLGTPIEIEVRDLTEMRAALPLSPAVIMLDNMSDSEIKKAVSLCAARKYDGIVEVSGGITLERLAQLKPLGVRYVSVGSLTHSVKAADISLRIDS